MGRGGIIVVDKFGNEIDLADHVNALMISKAEAADRAGISLAQFSALVRERIFPDHAPRSRLWNRKALSAHMDQVSIRTNPVVTGYVYFMQMGEFIKIGWSTWPESRRIQLQTSNPYDIILLGAFPGRIDQEDKAHQLFQHLRARGEWFRKSPGLLAYIAWQKIFWRGNANAICGDLDNVIRLNDSWKIRGSGTMRAQP